MAGLVARIAAARARIAREESGFTLMELLMATLIGTVVLFAAYGILDASVRAFGSSVTRTDVAQRGRLALDVMVQELRSPVCIDPAPNNAAFTLATPTDVKFTSGLQATRVNPTIANAGNLAPIERELVYSSGTITEKTRNPTSGATTTRPLVTAVAPVKDSSGNDVPVFQYFALTPISATGRSATVSLIGNGSVAATDLARIAMVRVSFQVVPKNADQAKSAAEFDNDVYVRAINPSSEQGTINCVGAP